MEKNIVLLAVEEYNELRDFKKEVEDSWEKSKFAVIEERWGMFGSGSSRKYYIESEIIIDFEKRNKELEVKNKELEAKLEKLGIEEPIEISIKDLKKMSYWEFRKFKKS